MKPQYLTKCSSRVIFGSAKTVFGRPSIRHVFGSTWKPSMSNPQATVAHTVTSFAHQRMRGNSTRANSTVVSDEINVFFMLFFPCCLDLDAEISSKMCKASDLWQCKDCLWTTKYKTRLWEHVEAKHVTSQGYNCPLCSKFCPSKNAWHHHKSRYHKGM